MTDATISFRADADTIELVEQLADEHDATKSEVGRALIMAGYRASKYYPDEFGIEASIERNR